MTERNDHRARLERNDKSRTKAAHYREEWSADEISFLMSQWPDAADARDEAVIAELLGRTIEACRQRFYVERREPGAHISFKETRTSTITTTETYIGHYDDPDECWWLPSCNNPNPNNS